MLNKFSRFALLSCLFFFVQCANVHNKKAIDEYIKSNIDYCMDPLIKKGMDSIQAREVCKCGLETMLKIEPNILNYDSKRWEQIFEANKDKIFENCPEIKLLL